MNHAARAAIYSEIEKERDTKVLAFVTSDRLGMETAIAPDVVEPFVQLLDDIGPTRKISLIIHTNGGSTLTAWRLVHLLRTFCDELEVIIPSKALSAGTLISIGADRIIMTKQAALGPIDPSVNHPLAPQVLVAGQPRQVPVSVEAVRGYLNAARNDLGIRGDEALAQVLIHLSSQIHPLVIGEIFRSRSQIRFLADKLISRQVTEISKKQSIIDFLCADSGSHDYTINRREAKELGLTIEKPTADFYQKLRNVNSSFFAQLKLMEPYSPQSVMGAQGLNVSVHYSEVRGLIESTTGGCFGYVSDGTMTALQVPGPAGPQIAFQDERIFEGWRKI